VSYADGTNFLCFTYQTTVNFGNGMVTAPTSINVPFLTFPTSVNGLGLILSGQAYGLADGILGIGPNAFGPGPSIPNMALPGDLNQGVLFNEPQGYMQFGPNPLTPIPNASVTGAPFGPLEVSVNGGPMVSVSGVIDSGGEVGTIPSSLVHGGVDG